MVSGIVRQSRVCLPGFSIVMVLTSAAQAHRPTFSDGSARDAEHALRIADIDVSQVVYHEVTTDAPQLWQTFEGRRGQRLWLQIGVPVLERLRTYRPAVAVLGPGFHTISVPFPVPPGLGGQVVTTEDVTPPREFHEEFTDTRSWILKETEIELPSDGRYYLVGYVPSQTLGKFWVAVGKREAFGLADWAQMGEWIKKARQFHETQGPPEYLNIPCVVLAILLLIASMACILRRV